MERKTDLPRNGDVRINKKMKIREKKKEKSNRQSGKKAKNLKRPVMQEQPRRMQEMPRHTSYPLKYTSSGTAGRARAALCRCRGAATQPHLSVSLASFHLPFFFLFFSFALLFCLSFYLLSHPLFLPPLPPLLPSPPSPI